MKRLGFHLFKSSSPEILMAFWTFDAEPGSEWKRTTAMYLEDMAAGYW